MKNATEILVILDESGSMGNIKGDIVGGYNTYIDEQKKQEGECKVTLVTFASTIRSICDRVDIKEVRPLTNSTYVTGGMTKLYDAIGISVSSLGRTLSLLKEEDRPDKVIVVIVTDGQENDSKQYSGSTIKEMLDEQKSKYSWQVIYLGVGADCIKDQQNLGFTDNNSYVYKNVNDTIGKHGYFYAASVATCNTRAYGCAGDVTRSIEDVQ